MMQEPVSESFKQLVLGIFERGRIVSLLFFGSRAFSLNSNEDSDYDFLLILDKYHPEDFFKSREIFKQEPFVSITTEIGGAYLYLSDIIARGKVNFQLRSTQSNFYEYLSNAKVLIGRNIFLEDPLHLSRDKIIEECDFKIQEYYNCCDGFKLMHVKISNEDIYKKLKNYTKNMIILILIREGIISIHDWAKFSSKEIFSFAKKSGIFSGSLIRKSSVLLGHKLVVKEEDILEAEHVRRLVYEQYLAFFKRYNCK